MASVKALRRKAEHAAQIKYWQSKKFDPSHWADAFASLRKMALAVEINGVQSSRREIARLHSKARPLGCPALVVIYNKAVYSDSPDREVVEELGETLELIARLTGSFEAETER